MSTYLGWTVVIMPALTTLAGTPVVPASMEFADNPTVAATTSEFTKQQQTNDFVATYLEGSVSYASMSKAQGQLWAAFIRSCHGTANVFTFPAGLCALFPVELTTDGTTLRYFRLKATPPHWTIKTGQIYSITFECREAT
jgi:hypothetical protein